MRGIQNAVALSRNHDRGHGEHSGSQSLGPICSDVAGRVYGRVRVPAGRQISNSNGRDREIVRDFNGNADVVVGQFVDIGKHLERAQRAAFSAVDNRRSFVIPAATIKARAHAVVCRIPAAANSVDDHLPDAVLDTAESLLDALYSFWTAKERYRCLIAQRSDRGI